MSAQPEPLNINNEALKSYALYAFDADETYQQGLASILATGALDPNASPDVKEEIIRRTRVFYFNQITGNSITIDEARDYERGPEGQPSASASNSAADDETRVLTFAELKELIESGKVDQIPNNKVIPEKINDETPSESKASPRRKPWESAESD